MSASLAWRANTRLQNILSAASWPNHTTFTSFYLKDISIIKDKLHSLGSLVAAQKVFPRRSISPLFLYIDTVYILHFEWESPAGIDIVYLMWWRELEFSLMGHLYPKWDSSLLVALGPVIIWRSDFWEEFFSRIQNPLLNGCDIPIEQRLTSSSNLNGLYWSWPTFHPMMSTALILHTYTGKSIPTTITAQSANRFSVGVVLLDK